MTERQINDIINNAFMLCTEHEMNTMIGGMTVNVTVPDALWDLVSLGMMGSLSSRSLSDLDSSSDHGFLFFTFLAGAPVPLGAGGFLTLGAPV